MTDLLTTKVSAIVERTFGLRGRGHVLVLSGQTGVVPQNGSVWNGSRLVPYLGPDMLDGAEGLASVTVTVADADLGDVSNGDEVRFVEL